MALFFFSFLFRGYGRTGLCFGRFLDEVINVCRQWIACLAAGVERISAHCASLLAVSGKIVCPYSTEMLNRKQNFK